jgi:hypothetical protein
MSKQIQSSLKLFSIGYVTQNKAYDSRIIQALPVESASATDGEVTHNPMEEILKGIDAQGNAYEVKATATRDLECEWYPFDDNRVTPPDVRRGELVEIYRLGNSTKYFWRCMNMRNGLRTLEHVVKAYGAKPSAGGAGVDLNSCYTTIISPLNGYINLQTTMANGEPYAYTVQINTKEGFVAITDDAGNYFELNSTESRLMLQNVDKSYIKVEKQWIDMKADKYIKMTCGDSTFEMKPTSIDTKTVTTTIDSDVQLNLNAPQVTVKCVRWDYV